MSKEIQSVLIANRGVIATRIMQTCKEMGLSTIGIYTGNDPDTAFLPFADKVIEIAEPGYLNKEKLIETAVEYNAAIHPGYGFLSENEPFARACQNANVPFIGPSPEALHIAGNKIVCHELLLKNNIPVIPSFSYTGNQTDIFKKAGEIGYPLLIKPAYGGGGLGMATVNDPGELENALHNTSLIASQYFTDGSLLIEKMLNGAKHIEVQILADQQGNNMHLFERECSMQRRKQKVIEEGLSPSLEPKQREELYELALRIASVIYLDNIGTIEFLFHDDKFYFLEINPRIQVEHAVTEIITGIDLVEWQIRLKNGETIREAGRFQALNGHSMEARIYAEDPHTRLPCPGIIEYLSLPSGRGIRIESAIWQGISVPENYDPLLMKIIVQAASREKCRLKMIMALQNLDINGTIKVNTMALLAGLNSDSFIKGSYDIHCFEALNISEGNTWQKELAGILGNLAGGLEKENIKKAQAGSNKANFWKPNFWHKREIL
jgi:acetyl-CoA carboxylase biotin carboxylase subunit